MALAYLLSVAAAVAIVIPFGGEALSEAQTYFTRQNIIISAVLTAVGTVVVAVGGMLTIAPSSRWFIPGRQPDTRQRRAAKRLFGWQSAILGATWVVSGAISFLLNRHGGIAIAVPTLLGVLFGGSAAAGIGLLLTQNVIRPILVAATEPSERLIAAPGVLARLILLWLLCSALPSGVIAALIFVRSNGWLIPETASVDIAVLVVSLAAVLLGLPTMILTSRSISDPIGEVVGAMAQVEKGQLDTEVDVFERSEIGRLQNGFNRMVAGLAERERLRDLFGRHVGANVARRAIEEGASLSGDVQDAAILFIDLVGSTQFSASHPPEQVANVLNDFFRIVVNCVDERGGLINKFQGDAALAVFGVPLRTNEAASTALATARDLADQLRQLPMVDFGIGVSAGSVFAGNIGAENRYEYTVIGDAVNEAARLADLAKTSDRRILCSSAAVERADEAERRQWTSQGSTVLRGRSEETHISTPKGGHD
ncbi:MAG: adenylate/guanylate cyclase domain-containing protein [Mycobacterium sp.]